MVDERLHEREHIACICRRYEHKRAIAERIFDSLGHIVARQVAHTHLGATRRLELGRQQLGCLLRVPVNRAIRHGDAFAFDAIGRPCLVQTQVVAEVFRQHRTMQRADRLNIQRSSLLEHVRYLLAEFAHNAEVIAPRLARPVLLNIKGAEFTECVCAEQNFVRSVVRHDDFRPMHHGRPDELQHMAAKIQRVTFLDHHPAILVRRAVEVLHHIECLSRSDNLSCRVCVHETCDVCGMIGFHMLDDQKIGRAAVKHRSHIGHPFLTECRIDRIHDRDALAADDVGVVSHAIRHDVLPFE